ncbi:MAG: hypothetical protein NTV05_14080 [Acidobacteria bacterium]|nr:hypothetical protein [Acidobacteriota bacterium]
MCQRFRMVHFLLVIVLLQGCSIWPELPPRPPNVPVDAVRLGGAKAQWWVKCSYKSGANVCRVFNGGGVVLEDDSVYRPYDGGPPVPEQELRIDPHQSMIQRLYLENGRILLLARAFDFHKGAIDAMGRAKR